ncbi:MAG: hypothetical protein ACYDAC_12710, partial [Candidatus Dormibacteria bacterium]
PAMAQMTLPITKQGDRRPPSYNAVTDSRTQPTESLQNPGRFIMLSGPDWFGVFDLLSDSAHQVFEAEFVRKLVTGQ